MITVVIAGIAVAIGAPSFTETSKNNRLVSQINEVTGAITFARSEAAKRSRMSITLCPSTDGAACAINSGSWESGWIIMVDVDGDRANDATDGDTVLKYIQPLSGGNSLRTSGFSSANYLQFTGDGMPSSAGTFTLCDARGANYAKAVVVSVVGQTRQAVDTDDDNIVNNDANSNVSCP
jgi:type IV fimbrial biogenesis protein FimT